MRNKGKINRTITTHVGDVTFCRSYYICQECGHYEYPVDEVLDISSGVLSKYCAQSAALMSSFVPFEHSRYFIRQFLGINISETCLKQLTHRIGLKLYHDAWKKGRFPYNLNKLKEVYEKLYIQMDGAFVPIYTGNQVKFKENKLAILYKDKDIKHKKMQNGETKTSISQKQYISSLAEGVDKFKKMLHAKSLEMGEKNAQEIVILGDGAPWIKGIKDEYFPGAVHILDWYHANEHLWETANKIFGDEKEKCDEWGNPLESLLWEGKVDQVIILLKNYADQNPHHKFIINSLVNYYTKNKEKMRYQEFRDKGYAIGSGAIESANKYIMSQRLKLSGMQWTYSHANAMIYLRSKYFSNEWDSFWEDMSLKEYFDHDLVKKYENAA